MTGGALVERRRRIIARVAHLEDAVLLERIERMLDDDLTEAKLVPLRDDDVDAILQHLLEPD